MKQCLHVMLLTLLPTHIDSDNLRQLCQLSILSLVLSPGTSLGTIQASQGGTG